MEKIRSLLLCASTISLPLFLASLLWATPQTFWVEAESASSMGGAIKKTKAVFQDNHSGTGWLECVQRAGKGGEAGHAALEIRVAKAGAYFVWLRTRFGADSSQSIDVFAGGKTVSLLGRNGFGFVWVKSRTPLSLRAGVNTVILTPVAQAKMPLRQHIDQVLVTQSKDFRPTGKQKTAR